jgi:hypothetical protein
MWASAMRPEANQIVDFYQDWGSARNYRAGSSIYAPHSISIPEHLPGATNSMPTIEYNAHPPTFVLLTLPFAWLDYRDAVFAWNVTSILALAVTLIIVSTELYLPRTIIFPTFALLAICQPVYGNVQLGQLTLLLGFLISLIWKCERSVRAGLFICSGLSLGLAASIKLFPVYIGVYYLAQWRLRPLLIALGVFGALNCIAAFILGIDSYKDYLSVVLPYQSKFRSFGYNISIAGFWSKLFDPVGERNSIIPLWNSPALARWGTLFSDILITLIVFRLSQKAQTIIERELAFGCVITGMLLVSPVTWDFSLPLLLIPLALIARTSAKCFANRAVGPLLAIMLILWTPQILLTKLALRGQSVSTVSWTFMLGAPSLKFYALLGVFALGVIAYRAERQLVEGRTSKGVFTWIC